MLVLANQEQKTTAEPLTGFKAKVALAAIKGERTLAHIGQAIISERVPSFATPAARNKLVSKIVFVGTTFFKIAFDFLDRMPRMLKCRATRGWRFPDNALGSEANSENLMVTAGFFLFLFAGAASQSILNGDRALHFDVLEAFAWGQEFQLGYYKHGPFWAWVAGAWFSVFPNTNTSFVLLESVNATLGLFGAWMLIGLFTKGWERAAATLLLVATPFYTFEAYKYNANTIFISLWPWTLYFFIRSVDFMKKRDAVLLGVFAAACILSKYYAALLLATCTLSLVSHPQGRRYLLSPLPWIAGSVFLLLVLPHLLWALNVDAPTIAYAMARTGKGWLFTGEYAGLFVCNVLLFQVVVVAIIYLASVSTKDGYPDEHSKQLPMSRLRFLAALVMLPVVLTIAAGLIFQLKIEAVMAVGVFPLMPLFLMQLAGPLDRRCLNLAGGAAVAVTVVTLVGSPLAAAMASSKKVGPSTAFPYRELAASVTNLWHSENHTPLKYIGADTNIANGISFYSPDRPSSFVELDYAKALWVTPEKIERNGLAIACIHEDGACLSKASRFLRGQWKQTSLKIGRKLRTRWMPEVRFDVFMIPPSAG